MLRTTVVLLMALAMACAAPARAADDAPSVAPILRIETGQHGAAINKLAVHGKERIAVTVSDDKTARVWSLAGEPLGVLRGPIGNGPEGALYAAAFSPSGRTVAVAGHTGLAWDRTASIYLFNRETGAWTGSIALANTPTDAINHIAFSPDGQAIAVGANDSKGLRVILPAQRTLRIADAEYKDVIAWLDFAADGRLVASSLDGGVRLYDKNFVRVAQWQAEAGQKPWAVAFSPDGKRIAVGLIGAPKVVLLNAADLKPVQTLAGAAGRVGDFSAVAWAADGKSLYAAGTYGESSGRKAIRRFPVGQGQPRDIAVSDDTVTDLKGLEGGGVLFASAEPAWGVIGRDDKPGVRKGRTQADYRDAYRGGFQVTPEGDKVTYGFARDGKKRARIDLTAGQLDADLTDLRLATPAKDRAGDVVVTDWRNGTRPAIGTERLTLDPGETSRSVVVGSDGTVVLGTDYFVRLYRDGKLVWSAAVPAPAWAIDIAPRGGYVVAGLGDGSVRWLRLSDGVARLNFYAEPDSGRWVAWTPEGLFDHGPQGESLIGFHQNKVEGTTPLGATFVRVEQLYGMLYRRDLVVKRLRGEGEDEIAALIAKVGDIAAVLARGLPPALRPTEICGRIEGQTMCRPVGTAMVARGSKDRLLPVALDTPEVTLRFEVEERDGGQGPIVLRRQGAPVATTGGTRSVSGKVRYEERTFALQPGLNLVTLAAFNAVKEIETDPKERPSIAFRVPVATEKPWMRVLSIGLDRFKSPQVPKLANAASDAKGLVENLRKDRKKEVYSNVDATLLVNEQATIKGIMEAFDKLAKNAKPDDLTVVFLAGHGVALDGKYYFIPYDLPEVTAESIAEHGLTHDKLAEQLSRLPTTRTMVVLDTCFSGTFAVNDVVLRDSRDQTIGRQISYASGRFILAGSASHQEALDGIDGHGVLTGVLLKGLAGGADAEVRGDKDGKVNILELGEFAKTRVPQIASKVGRGHEQKPRWYFNGDDMFNVRSVD
jgi:dipeptidyl aminopeptidase/acylaminoacyl peptidase